MYQHALPEAQLDGALRTAAVDCVALVGADANAASPALLGLVVAAGYDSYTPAQCTRSARSALT